MSEEFESSELVNELAMEQLEDDGGEFGGKNWHRRVALATLVLALLAALGGLLSGITSHEAQLEKTEEIISLTILEGDQVSIEILKAKHELLISMGETPDAAEVEEIRVFEEEVAEKQEEIAEEESLAQAFGQTHLIFAIAVTILAVGISVSGMAVVVDQKWLWGVGMVFGIVGSVGVILGIISMLFE
jgi:hypothetical protein